MKEEGEREKRKRQGKNEGQKEEKLKEWEREMTKGDREKIFFKQS